MNIQGYELPDDLYYERNHCWARVEGDLVVVATDFTQQLAGEFVYAELPYESDQIGQGKPFAPIESGSRQEESTPPYQGRSWS